MAGCPRIYDHLCDIVTPIQLEFWQMELRHHPDQRFATFILKGLQNGFRIGFNNRTVRLKASKQNLLSAVEHPEVVTNYIKKEADEGRIALVGSTTSHRTTEIHLSPLRAIPKKGRPNQWRLIMHLSAPNGCSMNDGINKTVVHAITHQWITQQSRYTN